MAILDNAKRSNETCHLLFADSEKCFDKLWLEDCLIDLKKAGMWEREVAMILKLNEKAKIEILTPTEQQTKPPESSNKGQCTDHSYAV